MQYIGIAHDEQKRIKDNPNNIYLLNDLKMTEADCLKYCYDNGYNWLEDGIDLYSILDRVSCWCCANKNMKELKNYKKYLPKYWEKLKDLQLKTDRPFKRLGKNSKTIFDIESKITEGD